MDPSHDKITNATTDDDLMVPLAALSGRT